MKEQIIAFENAKLAKEKGFNYPCKRYYSDDGMKHSSKQWLTHKSLSNGYLSPTQSLLQKWLREEHGIQIEICSIMGQPIRYKNFVYLDKEGQIEQVLDARESYILYEDALEKALFEALKLIEP